MSSDRDHPTLADYVALAISPALIMGLVSSLVFFLVNVLYVGEYVERMYWILFFFVFGAVLIARMTMQDETRGRATLYGVPLGFLTWLGMQMFVEYPEEGGLRELRFLLNAGLIGLVWWCAHRLTWDCTNLDEEGEGDAEGLLQAAGLEEQASLPVQSAETKAEESWVQRWRRCRAERNKKRTLGVWVVYFSLAALPLFGLGQALIPATDVARRQTSFWLLIVYVGCGLSLLLTTCFLGLRRYLRQRRLHMPKAMTGVWLLTGGVLIAGLLLFGALLPRPNAEYSLFSLSAVQSPQRGASQYAMKGGKAGKGEGRPGADNSEEKREKSDSGGDQDKPKGERGAATQRGQGQSAAQARNQNKGDPSSGRDSPAEKGDTKQARSANDQHASSDQQTPRATNGRRSPDKETSNQPTSPGRSPISALRDVLGRSAPVLKWVVFALLGLAVLFFVLRSGLQFLANFTDWARRLLDALRHFWANLFGDGRRTTAEEGQLGQEDQAWRDRPFASFRNPFAGGRIKMATPELICYTFAAAQAWARERNLGRQSGETALEFAHRVGAEVPALEAELHRLALLYARTVYARGGLPRDSIDVVRQFWQRLEAVVEQPLSA
jgi:hypothetical protein